VYFSFEFVSYVCHARRLLDFAHGGKMGLNGYVMVGLILIVGMVINSAILLMSFIKQQRERGVPTNEALTMAVEMRFRPIMMTSLSTIVGMIPLAAEWSLGAERFSPLAIAVIGGFTTSTFLTIVFIPVLYSIFDEGTEARIS
jgi:multidrug efflux pump subunit AcrB